jgi:hypothetical protein
VKGNQKTSRKYVAIVKIGNNPDGSAHCVKYRFDDLVKFTKFLDAKWSEWKWFNLFDNRGPNKGEQIANYTKNNRPI